MKNTQAQTNHTSEYPNVVAMNGLEVAYRKPGGEWKRTIVRTEAQLIKTLNKLDEDACEYVTRPVKES